MDWEETGQQAADSGSWAEAGQTGVNSANNWEDTARTGVDSANNWEDAANMGLGAGWEGAGTGAISQTDYSWYEEASRAINAAHKDTNTMQGYSEAQAALEAALRAQTSGAADWQSSVQNTLSKVNGLTGGGAGATGGGSGNQTTAGQQTRTGQQLAYPGSQPQQQQQQNGLLSGLMSGLTSGAVQSLFGQPQQSSGMNMPGGGLNLQATQYQQNPQQPSFSGLLQQPQLQPVQGASGFSPAPSATQGGGVLPGTGQGASPFQAARQYIPSADRVQPVQGQGPGPITGSSPVFEGSTAQSAPTAPQQAAMQGTTGQPISAGREALQAPGAAQQMPGVAPAGTPSMASGGQGAAPAGVEQDSPLSTARSATVQVSDPEGGNISISQPKEDSGIVVVKDPEGGRLTLQGEKPKGKHPSFPAGQDPTDATNLKSTAAGAYQQLKKHGRGVVQLLQKGSMLPGSTQDIMAAELEKKTGQSQPRSFFGDVARQAPAQIKAEEEQLKRDYPNSQGYVRAGQFLMQLAPYLATPAATAGSLVGRAAVSGLASGAIGATEYAPSEGSRLFNTGMMTAAGVLGPILGKGVELAGKGVGATVKLGLKGSGINAAARKFIGKRGKYSPTKEQIKREAEYLQDTTLDTRKTYKISKAAEKEGYTLTTGEKTLNPTALAREGRLSLTTKAQNELAKRNYARTEKARKDTQAVLDSMLRKGETPKIIRDKAKEAYKEIDQQIIDGSKFKTFLKDPKIRSAMQELNKSKLYGAEDFKLNQVGKIRALKDKLDDEVDNLFKNGYNNAANSLGKTRDKVAKFLDELDVGLSQTNKSYQRAIIYDKYANKLAKYKADPGELTPEATKTYRAIWGSSADRSNFLKDLKRVGGDVGRAVRLMRILSNLDQATIQRALNKDPRMVTKLMAQSGPTAVVSGTVEKMLTGHYNNQIMNVLTHPKFSGEVSKIAALPTKQAQANAVVDLLSRATTTGVAKSATAPKREEAVVDYKTVEANMKKFAEPETEKDTKTFTDDSKSRVKSYVDDKGTLVLTDGSKPGKKKVTLKEAVKGQAKSEKAQKMADVLSTMTGKEFYNQFLSTPEKTAKFIENMVKAGADRADTLRRIRELKGLDPNSSAASPLSAALQGMDRAKQSKQKKPKVIRGRPKQAVTPPKKKELTTLEKRVLQNKIRNRQRKMYGGRGGSRQKDALGRQLQMMILSALMPKNSALGSILKELFKGM